MKDWTIEEFKRLGMEGIKALCDEDFHSLALCQKDMFPDLLKICDEEYIIECFYRYYGRKLKQINE